MSVMLAVNGGETSEEHRNRVGRSSEEVRNNNVLDTNNARGFFCYYTFEEQEKLP